MDYDDDENENNNEPLFIPIARTFTVDLFEDRVLETFFEIDGDDRTTALKEEEANIWLMMCALCVVFLCGVCLLVCFALSLFKEESVRLLWSLFHFFENFEWKKAN